LEYNLSSDTGAYQPTGLAGAGEALAGLLGDDLNVTPEPQRGSNQPNPEENEVSPEDAAAMAAALEAEGGEAQPDQHETPDAEADGAEGEEAAAQDEDPENDADDGQVLVTVKIDGKTVQLPLDEVAKGYQRQADYSRKTAELAEQRRAHEEAVAKFGNESQAVSEERGQYAHLLKLLANRLQELEPAEPNWQELYAQDKQEYLIQRDQWNAYQEQKRIVAAEQERVAGLQHGEMTKKVQKMLADGRKRLLEYEPRWADEKVRSAELADLRKYAKENLGYTEEELANALDPRSVIAAHKAMKLDAIMAKAKNLKPTVKGRPKVLEAGAAARQPVPANNLTRAKKRQAATGSQADTAAVFESLLTF
jgi:uncharacterized protein YeeX (DUF496 family)